MQVAYAVMAEAVRVEVSDGVAVVSLNRPEKLNAMNAEVFEGLREAARRLEDDDAVRAVLLRGEGRAFSSGLDVSGLGGFLPPAAPALARTILRFQEGFAGWARMRKPVVAAVHGYAIGAGLQLALAADIRLCARGTVWSVYEVTYGLVPDLGGTQLLPRLVGPARAKELIWTARRFSAEEAERWGLVNRVVDAEALEGEALALASDLAARPPLAVGFVKELVGLAGAVPLEEGMRRESAAQTVCLLSEDMQEAVAAAAERRRGTFRGA